MHRIAYRYLSQDPWLTTMAPDQSLPTGRRLLDLGESLSRVVLPSEARRRVDRRGQRLAGPLFVSSFQRRQAEMVLDDGLVRQFRSAILEQVRRSLVHAALVENPAQRIRN